MNYTLTIPSSMVVGPQIQVISVGGWCHTQSPCTRHAVQTNEVVYCTEVGIKNKIGRQESGLTYNTHYVFDLILINKDLLSNKEAPKIWPLKFKVQKKRKS